MGGALFWALVKAGNTPNLHVYIKEGKEIFMGGRNSDCEGTPSALTVLIKSRSARKRFDYVVSFTGRPFSKPLALFRSITKARVRRHRHARVRCVPAKCFAITLRLFVRAVQQIVQLRVVTILIASPSGCAV